MKYTVDFFIYIISGFFLYCCLASIKGDCQREKKKKGKISSNTYDLPKKKYLIFKDPRDCEENFGKEENQLQVHPLAQTSR